MKTGKRIQLYVGDPLAAELAKMPPGQTFSGHVNALAARHAMMRHDVTPRMTVSEWAAICDALNGSYLLDADTALHAWASVADTEGLGDKWSIDQESLVAKLRALPAAARIAVAEVVEAFWARAPESDDGTPDALAAAGAKFLPSE